jgi:hypothetical protein
MRRFLCGLSLSVALLGAIGCGAAADAPKLPEAEGKKKAEEQREKQEKAMKDAYKKVSEAEPPGQ